MANGGILLSGRAISRGLYFISNWLQLGCGRKRNGACASYAMMLETESLCITNTVWHVICTSALAHKGQCLRSFNWERWMTWSSSVIEVNCSRVPTASRYELGQSAVQNQTQAFEMVDYGCSQGHARSCVKQGYYYLQGVGTAVDLEDLGIVKRRVQQKMPKAVVVGIDVREGRGVEQDVSVASRCLDACEMKEA